MAWRIVHDVLIAGQVRLAVQRIGIGNWQPGARLRSWGAAPLHRDDDAILVPCGTGEALWIGAWLEDGPGPARVELHCATDDSGASIDLPPDGQLTALAGAAHPPEPLAIDVSRDGARRPFGLVVRAADRRDDLQLVLVAPDDWASVSGRTPPEARSAPPPLPPRLG